MSVAVVKNGTAVVAIYACRAEWAEELMSLRSDAFLCQVVPIDDVPLAMLDLHVAEQEKYWGGRA